MGEVLIFCFELGGKFLFHLRTVYASPPKLARLLKGCARFLYRSLFLRKLWDLSSVKVGTQSRGYKVIQAQGSSSIQVSITFFVPH